jgi:hypothetical protein
MCALRAIRRDVLLVLGMTEMTYGWNLEMQMRAARSRLRILEVPVNNRPRLGGESKVAGSWRGSLRAGTRIVRTFGRLLLAPPGPGVLTPHGPGILAPRVPDASTPPGPDIKESRS